MPLPSWADGDSFDGADANDYVANSKQVALCVAVTAGTQAVTSGNWTGLLCAASEDVDTDGMHSTVSNTSRFTIPYNGIYVIRGWSAFSASSSGTLRQIGAIKNGSTATFYGFQRSMDLSASVDTIVECTSVPIPCITGDYLEIAVYQDSGSNRTMGVSRVGCWRARGSA